MGWVNLQVRLGWVGFCRSFPPFDGSGWVVSPFFSFVTGWIGWFSQLVDRVGLGKESGPTDNSK